MLRIDPSTQKQIAARLGVSQSLVSRALSGNAREIGAADVTIKKIQRVAAEWNYQPSATALALLGAPTRTIGVIVKTFDDPYFGKLIGALQSLARDSGHSLLLTGSSKEDLIGLQKHRVDGVIIVGSDFLPEGLNLFAQEGMSIAQIGTGTVSPGAIQIYMDEESAIREMVNYLAGLGHREIGCVAKETNSNLRRADILRQDLQDRGFSVRKKAFISFKGSDEGVAKYAAKALVGLDRMPTAVIATEDSIALALLREFYEAGIRAPKDLSLSGIDDISASAQSIPPLTTIRQPIPEMAAAAFRAITLSHGARTLFSIPGKLIIRRSCSPFR